MADELTNITEAEDVAESQVDGFETDDSDDASWDAVTWGTDEDAGETDTSAESAPSGEEATDEQPETEPQSGESETAESPEAESEDTDQYLEVKYMGENRKIGKAEAVTLTQKGLDYDRIRQERDTMQADYQTLKGYESFLNELKGDFPSINALMADTRARLLADKEHISYADAMAKVKNLHPEQEQKAEPKHENQVQGNPAVQKFVEHYPNVKAEEIPESVWAEVRGGADLTAAYEKYEASEKDKKIADLEAEIKTLKQNSKNAARSPGSSSSSGKTSSKSLIEKIWEDDD